MCLFEFSLLISRKKCGARLLCSPKQRQGLIEKGSSSRAPSSLGIANRYYVKAHAEMRSSFRRSFADGFANS